MPGKEAALKILKASLEGALCDLYEHLVQTDFGSETEKMLYSLRQNQFPSLLGPSDSIKTCSSDWAWFRNFVIMKIIQIHKQLLLFVCLHTHTPTQMRVFNTLLISVCLALNQNEDMLMNVQSVPLLISKKSVLIPRRADSADLQTPTDLVSHWSLTVLLAGRHHQTWSVTGY